MPHHKSAEKRVRTNERSRKRNITVKSEVRTVTRKFREQSGAASAPELLRDAHSALDNAARKGILHKKTVDRRKSRLAKLLNRSAKATPTPTKSA